MKTNISARTNGRGANTTEKLTVIIDGVDFGYRSDTLYPEDPFVGELRAHFEPSGLAPGGWNVEAYGHIHSDRLWLKEFRAGLMALGLSQRAAADIRYNNLELQGRDYVSLEVRDRFYAGWQRLQKKLASAS